MGFRLSEHLPTNSDENDARSESVPKSRRSSTRIMEHTFESFVISMTFTPIILVIIIIINNNIILINSLIHLLVWIRDGGKEE